MEIFLELLLTALLSLLVAFFLAKLLAVASASTDDDRKPAAADVVSVVDGGEEGGGSVEDSVRKEVITVEEPEVRIESVTDADGVARVVEFGREGAGAGGEEERSVELGRGRLVGVSVDEEGEIAAPAAELGLEGEEDRLGQGDATRSDADLGERSEAKAGSAGNDDGGESGSPHVEKSGEMLLDDVDDWEGIEKSELERKFSLVAQLVASDGGGLLEKLDSDVQMRLFGLHKIATEGPCYEPQPSVLKSSARAKWNAWQQLGNMNPDVAMEQYINLVSEGVPDWKDISSSDGNKQEEPSDSTKDEAGTSHLSSTEEHQRGSDVERGSEVLKSAEQTTVAPSE